MATFVLVHGTWHGGWCWSRVKVRLQQYNHYVLTPTLSGLSERANELSKGVNLDTHINDIESVIHDADLTNIVLCGHSYGGIVIAAAAERCSPKISSLVFIDAFIPEDGLSYLDLVPSKMRAEIIKLVEKHGNGWLLPPIPAEKLGVIDPSDQAWINQNCTPHPIATKSQPVELSGCWRETPSLIYITATNYKNSPVQRFATACKADNNWDVAELDCGHEIMIERPCELADLLHDKAGP